MTEPTIAVTAEPLSPIAPAKRKWSTPMLILETADGTAKPFYRNETTTPVSAFGPS